MPDWKDPKQFVLDVKRVAGAKRAKFYVYDFGDTIYLLEVYIHVFEFPSKWDTVY